MSDHIFALLLVVSTMLGPILAVIVTRYNDKQFFSRRWQTAWGSRRAKSKYARVATIRKAGRLAKHAWARPKLGYLTLRAGHERYRSKL